MAKKKLFADDEETVLLANSIALQAFRNPLEDLHSGITPDTKAGDFSDVKVVTPYGEIPWNRLSRISDNEMKELMIEITNKLFTLLANLDDEKLRFGLMVVSSDDVFRWDRPRIDASFLASFVNAFINRGRAAIAPHVFDLMTECRKAREG